ncbi:MAG: site-specific DNA-methyltransferase [Terriglobia bacterium]|jgi:DNA modification methylase
MPLKIEYWPISRIKRRPNNPRSHSAAQKRQIANSILEFNWTNPILVDGEGGLLAGHGRLDAAEEILHMTEVPVIVLDHLSPAQQRALVIADNQIALNAGWSEETLRVELQALQEAEFDLSLVGFDDEDLARLLAAEGATTGLTDEDHAPEVTETPVTLSGDRWLLGRDHILLVGDATMPADVERLMAGDSADLVFLDPPYNSGYTGYTEQRLTIQNDRMSDADFKHFLEAVFRSCRSAIKRGASMYVCHSSSWQREFQNALESAGFEVRCQIIWAKNTFAWGFGRYKFQHEPLFYCHVAGETDAWYGDKSQSTLWEESKPAASRLHPTMKPVGLVERALLNSSKAGDICADLCAGAGSTLIACECRGRKARLIELDPKYAQVIIVRWQQYSGKCVTLDGDGRTFEEIAQLRRQEAA